MPKRKQATDDDNDNDNNERNEMLSPADGGAQRRKLTAARPSQGQPSEFQQRRERLLWAARKVVDAKYLPVVMKSKINPNAGNGDWLKFRHQCTIEYSLELGRVNALYGLASGDVVVMGQNDGNQLACDKGFTNGALPRLIEELKDRSIDVAAAGMHSVVLTDNGQAYTFGSGDDGALGRFARDGDEERLPTVVTGFLPSKHAVVPSTVDNEDGQIVAVSAGSSHILYLTINGNVYMNGMFKDDSTMFASLQPLDDPRDVRPLIRVGEEDKREDPKTSMVGCRALPIHVFTMPQKVRAIASGENFCAAILADNSLVTWGIGLFGELARSATMGAPKVNESYELGEGFIKRRGEYNRQLVLEQFLTPRPVVWKNPFSKKCVTEVACGGAFIVVAARSEGEEVSRLYSSGINQWGQLGHGDTKHRHELTPVEALEDVPIGKVAAGSFHILVLDNLGTRLFACGRSDNGQIGAEGANTAAGEFVTTPTLVALPRKEKVPAVRLVDIACGEQNSFCWTSDGTIYSWGYNEFRQCGQVNDEDQDIIDRPKRIISTKLISAKRNGGQAVDTRVLRVSSGAQHSAMVVKRYNYNDSDN